MGKNSGIEWTDHTFNPWIGCSKVSPGCEHCYAEALMDTRYGRVTWGPNGTRVQTSESNWQKPLAWNRDARRTGRRQRVFCASLADVFEDRRDTNAWRRELFVLIQRCPFLDWLILTKRPEFAAEVLTVFYDGFDPLPNVWIGTSAEDAERADRIGALMHVPAVGRFLSVEPLLGPVLIDQMTLSLIDWVIVGGESGPKARPMHVQWARMIRDDCWFAGVPFFFKQWGEWVHDSQGIDGSGRHHIWRDRSVSRKVGKFRAGRLLDGVEHNQVPDQIAKART